jgi:hypothetical protein
MAPKGMGAASKLSNMVGGPSDAGASCLRAGRRAFVGRAATLAQIGTAGALISCETGR